MTQQPPSGPAVGQLKQLLKDRMNQGMSLAAKAAGQQAGTLAQAVRQTGEELRQQDQENQGRVADRVAAPVQRLSGNLSQADPQQLTISVKQVKPKLSEQAEQLKTQAGGQLKKQTGTRAAQAGQGVSALSQGGRQTSQQLRAQGQEVPALMLDALVEKVEPLGGYLTTADTDRLRSDISAYGRQAKVRLSSAANAVTRKRQAAAAKGTQAVKQTGSGMRRSPVLPIAGLLVGSVLAARRLSKAGEPQPQTDDTSGAAEAAAHSELENLSRAELQKRVESAGASTNPRMTREQLIEALRSNG